MNTQMNAIIAVVTYKRPQGLAALLESIRSDSSSRELPIVVVDNDAAGSAKSVACDFSDLNISYICEPQPGIAAARNCALEFALAGAYDGLAFVDDDEVVCSGWFERLNLTRVKCKADIVCGPVLPILPKTTSSWILSGSFFDRPSGRSGDHVRWPATNNVLIDLSFVVIQNRIRFSEEFSLTGGSDTDFFYRLREAGALIVWAQDAFVYESIPLSRANLKWLWRRGHRLGNVSARIRLRSKSKYNVALVGMSRVILAFPLVIFAVITRRSWGSAAMHLPKGLGMLQAISGNFIHEYKR